MDQQTITAEEFTKRLAQLCLTGHAAELPRKQRDRQIILKSVALHLSKARTYTERDLNAALMSWVGEVGHSIAIDHAALRRALIDEKYLERAADGTVYHLTDSGGAGWFAPEVDQIQPAVLIQDAILAATARRAQHQQREKS